MLGGIGVQEIVIILIVGLLVFGATRLPKIARSLGQGIKEFKKTVKGIDEDDEPEGGSAKYVQQPPPYPQQQYQQYPPQGGPAQQPNNPPGAGPVQGQQPPQGQYGAGMQSWAPGGGGGGQGGQQSNPQQNQQGGPQPEEGGGDGKKA